MEKKKLIKAVHGPRPKRSNTSLSMSDPVYSEGLHLYAKAIASHCKITDLKAFLGFLLLRGAYLENNHNEWLNKIFVEIRDLVREKDIGPLHLTLLMQAIEMRAKRWATDVSIQAYYKAKLPLAIHCQKTYEERRLEVSSKPSTKATPIKSRTPSRPQFKRSSSDSLMSEFSDAKIRHNRTTLNFECDIYLPTSFLVDIDDKTWFKLERKSDCRIKVNEDSAILQHISIEGPLKSNIRHCLEVLENLVLPDSGESDTEPIVVTPIKPTIQKMKSWPGHTEFERLSYSVRKASISDSNESSKRDPDGLGGRSGGAMTLQSKINNKYNSTKSREEPRESRTSPEEPTNRRVNHRVHSLVESKVASQQVIGTTAHGTWEGGHTPLRQNSTPSQDIRPQTPSAPAGGGGDAPGNIAPLTWPQMLDIDDVWGESDDDTFLSELEKKMEDFHLSPERSISQQETSPFGKYGIMATIEKHQSCSENADTRKLEKVARESMMKSWPSPSCRNLTPGGASSWPATPRKVSIDEETESWRSPTPHYDDSSSTTSVGSIHIQQGSSAGSLPERNVPVLRQPIHWAMSLAVIQKAESMIPNTGGLGAKKRRTLFRNTAADRMKAHGILHHKPDVDIQYIYEVEELLALALNPAATQSPSNFFDGWAKLVEYFPTVCLERPVEPKLDAFRQWRSCEKRGTKN